MKKKIKEFLINVWDEIEYGLRLLCGKPTPMKRFIIVLIIGGSLSIAFMYSIVSSIYNIGKRDAELMYIDSITNYETTFGVSQLQITNKKEHEYE